MKIDRRSFLYGGALAGGALALERLVARMSSGSADHGHLVAARGEGGYGPLQPVKAKNTGEALLALPDGFQYTAFGKTGARMSDGNPTPRGHDGMAAFASGDKVRLVRNHEVNNRFATEPLAFGDKSRAYDNLAMGGTTTLVIDMASREVVKDFVSLSGTLQNCAGGPTPWGSWITCEETVLGTKKITDSGGVQFGGFAKNHGYCFEVPAQSDTQVAPAPLKQMGRFVHEAIAVDPATGVVYLTEDSGPAGFYRFIPKQKGMLAAGGRLQMLAVKDRPSYDARAGQKVGAALPVTWVEIADPDPADADTKSHAVFNQGKAGGGASFLRLEGCWHGGGRIFFTSTSGGDAALGQVWEYQPEGDAAGRLTLVFESPSADLLKGPDNITVSPRGGLVLCEDSRGQQFMRGLTSKGKVFDFARNIVPQYESMEFAGATFSPDGQTLFVNIQTPGISLAIWGPWKNGAL